MRWLFVVSGLMLDMLVYGQSGLVLNPHSFANPDSSRQFSVSDSEFSFYKMNYQLRIQRSTNTLYGHGGLTPGQLFPHGFFCKVELTLEKKSALAPRFRLGSVNYTNWMEGKGAWFTRYWK